MNRRNFIKNTGLMGLSLASIPVFGKSITSKNDFLSNRPLEKNRTYQSDAVEETISFIKSKIKNKELSWMFENCYPNTIDTTVDYEIIDGKPDTFIITGDIDAMWLRDSTAQVWPYLPLIKKDVKIKNLIKGLINRQAKCVIRDPYANSFYKDLSHLSFDERGSHNFDEPSSIDFELFIPTFIISTR